MHAARAFVDVAAGDLSSRAHEGTTLATFTPQRDAAGKAPPRLSEDALAAAAAVMFEVAHAALSWAQLHAALDHGVRSAMGDAALAEHSPAAREAAAAKLIVNHVDVCRDLCNPSVRKSIRGKPLTQTELQRCAVEDAIHVDALLRETARR